MHHQCCMLFILFHFYLQKTGHKPESVDLCGAHIEWTKEKSSRKNVFQVRELHIFSLSLFLLNLRYLGNQNKITWLQHFHLQLVVQKSLWKNRLLFFCWILVCLLSFKIQKSLNFAMYLLLDVWGSSIGNPMLGLDLL